MRFLKRLGASVVAGALALSLAAPAFAAGGIGGDTGGASPTDEVNAIGGTDTGTATATWEANANASKEVQSTANAGKTSESKDKGKGTQTLSVRYINPRNVDYGGVSKEYRTACVNGYGFRIHWGSCTAVEKIYGYAGAQQVYRYKLTAPSYVADQARQQNGTRVTSKSSVSGNPGVSCTATKSSTSNGITTTSTLRSMSYSVKYIQYVSKNYKATYGSSGYSFTDPTSTYNYLLGLMKSSLATAQNDTAAWHAAGYKTDSEASGAKTKIGCYYNTKMTGRATAWFGSAKCVVGYKVDVIDERTGATVATKSEKTAYGNNPTFSNCKGGLYASINVSDLVPDGFGKWRYVRTLTYDNPNVEYSTTTGAWKLTNTLVNTSDESNVFYIRTTCNPSWNGIWKTPQSDTVSKGGSSYTIKYTQQDCESGEGVSQTKCAMPSQGNSAVDVIVSNDVTDYNDAKNNISADGKVTLIRNGIAQHITTTIPKIGVTSEYSSYFGGKLPKNLSITLSNVAKNVDGTPWNNNVDVRSGVPLNRADLADFVIKKTGASSWIATIVNDSSITSWTDGESYYTYKVGTNAVNTLDIASRWESTEGKPTILRSDYTIKGDFPYKKWTVAALGPNGAASSTASSIAYATSTLRCVSGPTTVETVRSVS